MNKKIYFNSLKAILFLGILLQYYAIYNKFYLLSSFSKFQNTQLIILFSSIFCILPIFNILIRFSSLVVCLSNLLIFYFNPYILQLQIAYTNFILACIFLFSSEPLFDRKSFFNRHYFSEEYWKKYVHILFSMSLFTSGLSKLRSDFWQEGTALWYLCSNNAVLKFNCELPVIFFKIFTYTALVFEIFSILAIFERVRMYVYIMQLLLLLSISTSVPHIGIYTFICFLFLIEESWLSRFKKINT